MNNINDILDFAINNEQEAHDFYKDLASKAKNPALKETLLKFSGEELSHKKKIETVKSGQTHLFTKQKIQDLKIANYLVDIKPTADMDYQQILTVAMKKELAAYRLYTFLSQSSDDPSMKTLFASLAQEEAGHKLRFEIEFDDYVNKEN
ncbi:MAG: ferritin family protein [Deltaproteobacteria bacterium]|nr:ferritin family protein [Deltaproteobacteria bacterium]